MGMILVKEMEDFLQISQVNDFMQKIPFVLVEEWQSSDIRPGRENEKWLNLILRKK